MPVPAFESMMLPVLEAVRDGKIHKSLEIRHFVAAALSLTEADLAEMLPSRKSVFTTRCAWARKYLTEAGLLTRPQHGRFKITRRGLETLRAGVDTITSTYLYQFPEFKEFRNRWRNRPHEERQPDA